MGRHDPTKCIAIARTRTRSGRDAQRRTSCGAVCPSSLAALVGFTPYFVRLDQLRDCFSARNQRKGTPPILAVLAPIRQPRPSGKRALHSRSQQCDFTCSGDGAHVVARLSALAPSSVRARSAPLLGCRTSREPDSVTVTDRPLHGCLASRCSDAASNDDKRLRSQLRRDRLCHGVEPGAAAST